MKKMLLMATLVLAALTCSSTVSAQSQKKSASAGQVLSAEKKEVKGPVASGQIRKTSKTRLNPKKSKTATPVVNVKSKGVSNAKAASAAKKRTVATKPRTAATAKPATAAKKRTATAAKKKVTNTTTPKTRMGTVEKKAK